MKIMGVPKTKSEYLSDLKKQLKGGLMNKEDRTEWKRLHKIFAHGEALPFGAREVLRYDDLSKRIGFYTSLEECTDCLRDELVTP
jgi:hypothetical protein